MASLNLSIKSPCSENWNSFEKNGKVGFCSSCKKNVVDFTKYSDREIIEFFDGNDRSICGRFSQSQLKDYREEKKGMISKMAAIVTASILAFSQAPDVKAQPVQLTGRVVDETGAVSYADISIKDTEQRIRSGQNGEFVLNYDGDQDEITIVFFFVGCQEVQKTVRVNRQTDLGEIWLEPDIKGEVCVTRTGNIVSRAWRRATSIFRR